MQSPDTSSLLHLAKGRVARKPGPLASSSLESSEPRNPSQYTQMSLAEFSSIYNFSQTVQDIETVRKEVAEMKANQNKNFASADTAQKIAQLAAYLRKAKGKHKDDAVTKMMTDKPIRKDKMIHLPNIAQEVVKRCSQPEGYLLFRRYHDFLPWKTPSPTGRTTMYPSRPKPAKIKLKQFEMMKRKNAALRMQQELIQPSAASDPGQEEVKKPFIQIPVSSEEGAPESPFQLLPEKRFARNAESARTSPKPSRLKEPAVLALSVERRVSKVPPGATSSNPSSILASNRTRHNVNLQQEALMRQVMEMFWYQQRQKLIGGERMSGVEQERELMQIVKIVSIERNLSREQTEELILGAMRQLLEQELNQMEARKTVTVRPLRETLPLSMTENVRGGGGGGGGSLNRPSGHNSRNAYPQSPGWGISRKLASMREFQEKAHVLVGVQQDIEHESHLVRREMESAKEWFEELEKFYELLREGDMPEQKDAQALFEVKTLEQIWNYKEQFQMVHKFKQIAENGKQVGGLLTIHKYEHNKFVRENAKRKHELKLMT